LNFEEKVFKNLKLKSDKAVEDGRKKVECVERKREERETDREERRRE
jgi:hypothetical protein